MKGICIAVALLLCLLAGCTDGERSSADTAPDREAASQAEGEAPQATNGVGTYAVDLPDTALAEYGHGELSERPAGDVVEIGEKIFVAQVNDIYLNAEDYLGKTIQYEGIFQSEMWTDAEGQAIEEVHYVFRYGPGCCGTDGNAGFEVLWDREYPEENDWVEAVGTLQIYEYNGWKFLQLHLDTLTVLEERGAEYVYQ